MRIPVTEHWGAAAALTRRDDHESHKNKKALIVVSIIVVAIFAILIITYLLTLKFRPAKHKKPKSQKLPSLWDFRPWRRRQTHEYSASLQDSNELEHSNSREREMSGSIDPERQSQGGVDRNTSIRSVMTLPAYSPAARENEQILGREGERGGVDTVVEFPETEETEEQRREDEMESLYQIRLARRAEAREREERRQARREARSRHDHETLAELRRQAELAQEESLSAALIVEHQAANRERRVSSVQYGDLGVARHDGTRLRANSSESDNRPLLDSAASISGHSQRPRGLSSTTLNTHYRNPSASSVLSVSSHASNDFQFPEAHSRNSGETGNEDFEVVSLQPRSRSASRSASPLPTPTIDIPHESPPNYEDHPGFEEAPPYESPQATRAPQLPTLERLPSIQVTTETSPVEARSNQSLHGDK